MLRGALEARSRRPLITARFLAHTERATRKLALAADARAGRARCRCGERARIARGAQQQKRNGEKAYHSMKGAASYCAHPFDARHASLRHPGLRGDLSEWIPDQFRRIPACAGTTR